MRKLSKNKYLKKFWPIGFLLLVVAAFFWRVILLGEIPLPADFVVGTYFPWLDYKWGYAVGVPVKNAITSDVVSFTFPMQIFAIKLLKMGIAPLWNPHILTGTPLLANFQSAPFAINNIFYFFTDVLTGWTLKVMSQHFLAATFTYLLLRHWKLGKFASVFGSVVFAFAGFAGIWSQWNAHLLAASFIPLILLLIDKYLDTKKISYAVFLSFSLFLQITSGYPQVVFYTLVPAFLLWLFRFKKDKSFFVSSATLFIFAILGIFLSSIQILPAWELLQHSQRETEILSFEGAFLPWSQLITFVAPDFFGNHTTQNYWGLTNYTTTAGYVGVIAFVFAGVAFPLFKKKKEVLYAIALSLTALLLALPTPLSIFIKNSGIFGLQAASAHRALVLFNLGIAVLSSFGIQSLLEKKRVEVIKPLLLPGILLFAYGLYALAGYLYPGSTSFIEIRAANKENLMVSLRNMVLPTFLFIVTFFFLLISRIEKPKRKIIPAVFLLLMILELFRFGWKFNPFTSRHLAYPTTPVIDYLLEREKPFRVTTTEDFPNIKMAYEIETLEGYDAIYPAAIAKYVGVLNSGLEASPQGRHATVNNFDSRLLDLTNTKYLVALKRDERGNPSKDGVLNEEFQTERFETVFEDKTTVVLENKDALPRAFVVNDWEVITDENKTLERLLDEDFPLRERIILQNNPGIETTPADSDVSYLNYQSQKSTLLVKSDSPGLLFVSELYYPGWEVFIDGEEGEILKANYAFRAVPIPEGEYKVQFIYEPESFKIGGWLSIATLIFLLGVFFYDQKSKVSRGAS